MVQAEFLGEIPDGLMPYQDPLNDGPVGKKVVAYSRAPAFLPRFLPRYLEEQDPNRVMDHQPYSVVFVGRNHAARYNPGTAFVIFEVVVVD